MSTEQDRERTDQLNVTLRERKKKKKRSVLHKTATDVSELVVFTKNIMVQLITVNPVMHSVFEKRIPGC